MSRRREIVAAARLWIGTPYRHQASLPGVGCDCLGLVRGVWREIVGDEPESPPPYTQDWAEAKADEALLAAALRWFTPVEGEIAAGDVIVFRWRDGSPAKHLGIATEATRMIHAHDGACVCEVHIGAGWRRRIAGVFAFPDA
jgi:NlpC/P60 family putative phage cell wall peptidase